MFTFLELFNACTEHFDTTDLNAAIAAADLNGMKSSILVNGSDRYIVVASKCGYLLFSGVQILQASENYRPMLDSDGFDAFVKNVFQCGYPMIAVNEILILSTTNLEGAREKYRWIREQIGDTHWLG